MTSYETIQLLQRFISVVEDKPNLNGLLSTAESKNSLLRKWMRQVLTSSDNHNAWKAIAELNHNLVNAFAVDLKETGSRKLYGEVEQILSEIESLRATNGNALAELNVLGNQLIVFIDLYESFLHKTSRENVLELIEGAADLKTSLDAYLGFSITVKNFLDREEDFDQEGYAKLSLLLSCEPIYKNLLIKLTAVNQLYNELCNLLEVSSAEYPLKVARMEAGSLWLKIFGENKVVALLTRLIEAGAVYLYRTFTTEGQIRSIPRQVESIEVVLKLSESLQLMGIDTTKVNENLQKSTVVVSSKLNDLLLGSPSIKVNDRDFSVGDAVTEKYLTESRRLLLNERKETESL